MKLFVKQLTTKNLKNKELLRTFLKGFLTGLFYA